MARSGELTEVGDSLPLRVCRKADRQDVYRLVRAGLAGARSLVRSVLRPERCRVSGELILGMGNPAWTGIACGWLTGPQAWLKHTIGGMVKLRPDFTGQVFSFRGSAVITLIPGTLLAWLVETARVWPWRSTWRLWRLRKQMKEETDGR
jgi:hypothetical protein